MGILNPRGHEVLDTTPIEIPLCKRQASLSIFERMQQQILLMKKEQEDVIVDDADMAEDLNDFSYEDESMLFVEDTPYTVPDDVSDRVSAKEIREKSKKKAQEKVEEKKVETSSDSTE